MMVAVLLKNSDKHWCAILFSLSLFAPENINILEIKSNMKKI